jgi:hypothetical protein
MYAVLQCIAFTRIIILSLPIACFVVTWETLRNVSIRGPTCYAPSIVLVIENNLLGIHLRQLSSHRGSDDKYSKLPFITST